MELVAFDVHGGKLLVGDLAPFLVVAGVQARVDLQAGAGRGRADQVDDHLQALKRPSAPVEADVAEHAMLDFVPLRRPGRKVADADRQRELVGELLQLGLPQARAAGVAAAAVSSDRQARRVGVALLAEVLPPRADRVDRERACVMGDTNADHPLVGFDVEHAVRDRVPQILVLEIMAANLDRPAGRLVFPPGSLEIPEVSRRGESHPPALADPGVSLSTHRALVIQPWAASASSARTDPVPVRRPPLGTGMLSWDGDATACISAWPFERDTRRCV